MPSSDINSILSNARDTVYPEQIWWFMASFIALLVLFHFIKIIQQWRSPSLPRDPEKNNNLELAPHRRRSISRLPIAIYETITIILFRYTVSFGYSRRVNWAEIAITMHFLTPVAGFDSDPGGLKIDPNYYADRAGNAVASQIPLLVILSGKNNLLSIITGISFEKLHILHRAIARFSIVLILAHAGGRISLGLTGSDVITEPWLRTGIAAFSAWVIIAVMFIKPFRSKYYNIFVIVHLVLALMITIGLYFHIQGAAGYQNYIVPAFVFWGFDRVTRIARVFWNNRGFSPSPIKIEILSPNTLKLSINQWMSWKAGQSAYLTIPKISMMPFEAHPFTISTIPTMEKENNNEPNELVFIVKVRNGFTKRLYHTVSKAQELNEEFLLNAFVDGPYGSPPELDMFSDIVIITGGSGISFGLPLLGEIVRNKETGRSRCSSVLLVWAVATPDFNTFTWILESFNKILTNAPSSLRVRIHLHATGPTSSISSVNEEESKRATPEIEEKSPMTPTIEDRMSIVSGRPNIASLLEEELSSTENALAVNVAGPFSMVEDVRKALRFNLITPKAKLHGQPRVQLHTEPYEIAVRAYLFMPL
ncbi:hypothetical protein Clacol_002947 [Clathrus columnatus]|uniref:ferric-chelate reductase (NADPH) n=1 Tax=Clathrus columnatus TaxID=1419009 RepID=A0AAV5A7V6_9AGAM|nr:hypothetical protein Clacol_002947 [Clathrus columnatus]